MTADLLAAFGIGRGEVVALVGAGGKTSLAVALAAQACAAGQRTLLTSTTKMGGTGGPDLGPLVLDSDGDGLDRLQAALAQHGRATLLGQRQREDKLIGVSAARVDAVRGLADLVLVEADGARRRSLKMPATHEPVLPASTTLMVVLAGLDVLGAPLDADHVHRLEQVVAAIGREAGRLDEAALAAVLMHPAGYLSRIPAGARSGVFLNKAEDAAAEAAAVRLAARLASHYDIVACGSAQQGTGRRL